MESVPALSLTGRAVRRGSLASAVLLVATFSVGCVTTGTSLWPDENAPPKPSKACQVVCTWQNNVALAPDPAHGGAPTPGFAGRLFLFGENIDFPLVAEGSLVVDLIDETYEPAQWRERWNIDAETLQRLLRKDMIG